MRFPGVVLAIVLVGLTANLAAAGSGDLSVWAIASDGDVAISPWYVHSGKAFNLDVRYNFDQTRSLTAFMGKTIKVGKFSVSPSLGLMAGDYSAGAAQVNLFTAHDRLSVFSMNVCAVTVDGGPNSFEHFTDALVRVHPKAFLGLDEFIYKEVGDTTSVTVGPTFKVLLGRGLYGRVWVPYDLGDKTVGLTVGLGYSP